MPVPRRRHCPSRRDRRRAHTKLEPVAGIVECPKCAAPRLPHRACPSCGEYNGRIYKRVKAVKEAKQ
jgi:large subunit ribosomal protein L32